MDDSNLKIPIHVAIIMDGNRRWAKEHNLSSSDGHRAGMDRIKSLSESIFQKGVQILSIFAFSTENFKRSKKEVDYLMRLFIHAFENEFSFYNDKNIRIVFSGRKEPLPSKVWKSMQKVVEDTKENTGGILNICLNYGGHAEIIDACKKICEDVSQNKVELEKLNETMFGHYLYQDLAPIDLLIRTSGEERISNFMLWQMSYAEFYFIDTFFPDFDEQQFDEAILEYNKRTRKFGGENHDSKNP